MKCPERGWIGSDANGSKGSIYTKEHYARAMATRHRNMQHGTPAKAGRPKVYRFTRDQLIDALTRLEAYPAPRSDGKRSFIVAESMADALIEALKAEWDALGGGRDD